MLPPDAPLSADDLLTLLRRAVGSAAEIDRCSVANRADDYLVLLLEVRRPSVSLVVKVAGPTARHARAFDRTAMLQRLIRARTDIPVPDVLAVDATARAWPWRYLVQTYVPGEEWATARDTMDATQRAAAYARLGDAVGQLHAIHFPAFGELEADGSIRGTGAWLAALTARATGTIPDPTARDAFLAVAADRAAHFVAVAEASLCHDDLHKHNVLFRHAAGRWDLATILDFDKAWAGHAETDLARLELWTGMVEPPFWPPYLARQGVRPGYEARRPVYQLMWCLEYARATREHAAVTRRICTELGVPGGAVERIVTSFR